MFSRWTGDYFWKKYYLKKGSAKIKSNKKHPDVATSKVAFNIVGLCPNLLYYRQFSISACIISNDFVRSPKDNETLGICLERDS
jgi:hypothetical protein